MGQEGDSHVTPQSSATPAAEGIRNRSDAVLVRSPIFRGSGLRELRPHQGSARRKRSRIAVPRSRLAREIHSSRVGLPNVARAKDDRRRSPAASRAASQK